MKRAHTIALVGCALALFALSSFVDLHGLMTLVVVWIGAPVGAYVVLQRIPTSTFGGAEFATTFLLASVSSFLFGAASLFALDVSATTAIVKPIAKAVYTAAKDKPFSEGTVILLTSGALAFVYVTFLRLRQFRAAKARDQERALEHRPGPQIPTESADPSEEAPETGAGEPETEPAASE